MDLFIFEKSGVKNVEQNLLKRFYDKKISDENKQQEHSYSYLMLDRILKEVYSIFDTDIEYRENKPYLKNKKKYFSISHSGEYIIIAFSDYDCGADIERIKQRDYLKIAKRMKLNCGSLEDFYYDWTKYEAEYKLKSTPNFIQQFKYKEYIVTVVSEYFKEDFMIYIQNGESFSNFAK